MFFAVCNGKQNKEEFKVNFVSFRFMPFFVYVFALAVSMVVAGDGSQTRSFQYVDDLVRGLIALMNSNYDHPVNIGNPDEYTVKDFAQVRNTKKKNEQHDGRKVVLVLRFGWAALGFLIGRVEAELCCLRLSCVSCEMCPFGATGRSYCS